MIIGRRNELIGIKNSVIGDDIIVKTEYLESYIEGFKYSVFSFDVQAQAP